MRSQLSSTLLTGERKPELEESLLIPQNHSEAVFLFAGRFPGGFPSTLSTISSNTCYLLFQTGFDSESVVITQFTTAAVRRTLPNEALTLAFYWIHCVIIPKVSSVSTLMPNGPWQARLLIPRSLAPWLYQCGLLLQRRRSIVHGM